MTCTKPRRVLHETQRIRPQKNWPAYMTKLQTSDEEMEVMLENSFFDSGLSITPVKLLLLPQVRS